MDKVVAEGCGLLNITSLCRLVELMNPKVELLDYQKQVLDMAEKYRDTYETMKSLELLIDTIPQEPTIEQLKKQIKYSKNPLEVKMLNRQLNQRYKDMKRR